MRKFLAGTTPGRGPGRPQNLPGRDGVKFFGGGTGHSKIFRDGTGRLENFRDTGRAGIPVDDPCKIVVVFVLL